MKGSWQTRGRGSQAGLSLVEVLIALALLGVFLLGLIGFNTALIHGTQVARRQGQAVVYARAKIEELKNTAFGLISIGTYTDTPATGITRTWTGTLEGGSSDLKRMTVLVSFTGTNNRSYTVTQETFFTP